MGAQQSQGPARYTAARSVHCWWEPDSKAKKEHVTAFCNAVTVKKSTPGSYFMMTGFPGGYGGVQEMDCTSDGAVVKRVLFSVWDHSSEMYQGKADPRLVPAAERVEVLYAAPFVQINRFGGEGTGAQCIWETQSDRFKISWRWMLVTECTCTDAHSLSQRSQDLQINVCGIFRELPR